jgi:hypothetical protein
MNESATRRSDQGSTCGRVMISFDLNQVSEETVSFIFFSLEFNLHARFYIQASFLTVG